jgi:flagellar assembly protein FliH
MSLSDSGENRDSAWGTVFMPGGERSLGGMEHTRDLAWTEKDEAGYLARVRQKAVQMAAGIIAEANAEAERIKEAARREGYAAGHEEARLELEEFRTNMSDSVQTVLGAIEGQCSHIFEQWREDLVALTRLAVERVTDIEIAENRRAMLEALLVDATGLLERRRELVIRVNPEDEPVVNDIVEMTRERFADVRSWRVKADPDLSPGGMVIESESSLAEGRVESRRAAVDEILRQMTLPEYPGEESPEKSPGSGTKGHTPP